MQLPQVILVGGPPGAGKTTLGRGIAAELGYDSLTVDDLAVAVRAVTTQVTHRPLHLMTDGGSTRYFTEGPVERLIQDAVALESTMWPVVERVTRRHLAERSPVVMDWWLLSPMTVAAVDDPRVGSVWLHIDSKALEERERLNTEFFGGSEDPERMLANFMLRSLWRNELVASEAEDSGVPLLRLTGREPQNAVVEMAIERLSRELPRPGGLSS